MLIDPAGSVACACLPAKADISAKSAAPTSCARPHFVFHWPVELNMTRLSLINYQHRNKEGTDHSANSESHKLGIVGGSAAATKTVRNPASSATPLQATPPSEPA